MSNLDPNVEPRSDYETTSAPPAYRPARPVYAGWLTAGVVAVVAIVGIAYMVTSHSNDQASEQAALTQNQQAAASAQSAQAAQDASMAAQRRAAVVRAGPAGRRRPGRGRPRSRRSGRGARHRRRPAGPRRLSHRAGRRQPAAPAAAVTGAAGPAAAIAARRALPARVGRPKSSACARPSTKPPIPSFGREHAPLIRAGHGRAGAGRLPRSRTRTSTRTSTCPPPTTGWPGPTGFTGSAGAAVILKDKAAIFVDGRYALQVRDQVDPSLFEIRDLVDGGVPAYLAERGRGPAGRIGYDPRLHSPDALERLRAAAAKAGAALKPVDAQSARRGLGRGAAGAAAGAGRPASAASSPARTRPPSARASARAWPSRARTRR